MTRKPTRNYSLSVVALLIAVLTLLIGATMLAQTSGAGRPSGQANAALVPAGTSAPLTAGRPLMPWTVGTVPFPVGRAQTKRQGAVPMDEIPPLFLPAVSYDSGGGDATSVAVADLNGDGKPDLVVTNWCASSSNCNPNAWGADGTVAVLLGNGDGTFQPAVAYASGGASPDGVVVADVNGDGKADLIVVNWCASGTNCSPDSGSVGVLLGNGDGTFQAAVSYNSGGVFGQSVAVADLNGDGKPDLVVGNWAGADGACCRSPALSVLLGNGDGTFQPAVTYSSGVQVAVAVGDVNGDHRPDLVVADFNGYVEILLGKGDGTFQTPVTYGTGGSYPRSVALADLNGDGKLDIVVGNNGSANIGVLLGNGNGTFQPAVTYGSGEVQPYLSVAVADVNGDGKPDILVANNGSGTVGVLPGNGDGTFQAALTYSSGGILAMWVVAADVNGDDKPDLVVGNTYGNGMNDGAVGVLLSNTNSTTTTTLASSANPSIFGQAVTFTAAVSAASGTPTGTVILYDGSTTLGSATLANGSASMSTSALAVGSHSITGAYQGLDTFQPSTSAPLNQLVNPAATTTSLVSSANPARIEQSVTYTATITSQYGAALTGTVTFQDGGVTIATVTLVGIQAAYTTKYAVPGTHAITAMYSGDANSAGSASSALVEQINKAFASKTVVTTSGSSSFVGQPVTFTATVTSSHGPIPDGELVTFHEGTTILSSVALASGTAAYTTSSLPAKSHTIKATYAGDTTFEPSTGWVVQVVDTYPTTTVLGSSANPSAYGQAVTFTATVTPTGPYPLTGRVWFKDGTIGIGSATVSGGVATLTKLRMAVGTHPITAQYLGDSANGKSTSAVLNQVVQ